MKYFTSSFFVSFYFVMANDIPSNIKEKPIRPNAVAWPIERRKHPLEWATANIKSLLGGALLGQKKYANAELMLLSGYQEMKTQVTKIPKTGKVWLVEAVDRLIQFYTETNKPEEMKKWQQEKAKYINPVEPTSK